MADALPTETRGMSFAHPESGKSSQLDIKSERFLGEGHYAKVYEADVLVHGRSRKFAIKKFKDVDGETAKENAAHAMRNYQLAKKSGLKVFNTYRLGEDETSILMTNGDSGSTILIGNTFQNMLIARGESMIQNIDENNWEQLVNGVYDQALIADRHGLAFHEDDAFFFLLNKETGKIDFVVGDVDRVDDSPIRTPYYDSRIENNLGKAQGVLQNFLGANVARYDRYKQRISDRYNQIKVEQGIR